MPSQATHRRALPVHRGAELADHFLELKRNVLINVFKIVISGLTWKDMRRWGLKEPCRLEVSLHAAIRTLLILARS